MSSSSVVVSPVHAMIVSSGSSLSSVHDIADDEERIQSTSPTSGAGAKLLNIHEDTSNIKPPSNNSYVVTVFLILNTMIGSGILNQPQVFLYSGIIGALVIFVFASYYTWLGLVLLVDVGTSVNVLNYSELAKVAFGRNGEWALDFFIVLYCWGGLMSYITVVGGTSSELFVSWGCTANFCQVLSTTSFFIFVFDLPLCLVRFYGHYGVISIISMISIMSVLALVIIGGPIIHPKNSDIIAINAEGTMAKIGSVVFALGCAPATFHAYTGLQGRSAKEWKSVSTNAVVIGALMCCVMGVSGYLVFGNSTKGEIIDNFPGVVAAPFKILLIIHLILYIPIDFVVMRFSVIRLLGYNVEDKGEFSFPIHALITLILLTIPLILVLILRASGLTQGAAFGFILDFTGGIAASFTSFIMPAAIYLALTPTSNAKYYWHAASMLTFGIFIIFTVPIINIMIISGGLNYDPQNTHE